MMSAKAIEQELLFCRLILQAIATAKVVCRSGQSRTFLNEIGDRTAIQIAVLQAILLEMDRKELQFTEGRSA